MKVVSIVGMQYKSRLEKKSNIRNGKSVKLIFVIFKRVNIH